MERKNIILLIKILSSIIIYIVIINVISSFSFDFLTLNSNQSENLTDLEGPAQIGVGDSVTISVMRPRVYGKIIEENGDSRLYLLGYVPIPIKIGGVGFIKFHIIFLVILAFFFYRGNKKYKKVQIKIEEKKELSQTRSYPNQINYQMNENDELPPLNF